MVEHCSVDITVLLIITSIRRTGFPTSEKKELKRHGNPIGGKRHTNSITNLGVEEFDDLGRLNRKNEVLLVRVLASILFRGEKDFLVGVDSLFS